MGLLQIKEEAVLVKWDLMENFKGSEVKLEN